MANPFDQFDAGPPPASGGSNPFDQFDPKPAANPFNQFDAKPAATAAAAPAPQPQGFFSQVGQAWDDATNPNHPQHAPNPLESTIIGAAYSKPVQYAQGVWNENVANSGVMRGSPSPLGVATTLAMRYAVPGGQQAMQDPRVQQMLAPGGITGGNVGLTGLSADMGVGLDKVKAAYPGRSDEWYQNYLTTANNLAARRAAQAGSQQATANVQGSYGPNASLADRAARFGQQTLGVATGMAANPQYFAAPGMSFGGSFAARALSSGAANAAMSQYGDMAAQAMDMAQGAKKDFDVDQNIKATAVGLLGGVAGHAVAEGAETAFPAASTFVKGLFSDRGMDTKPPEDPRQSLISPMTTDHVAMNASDHMQYQQLLKTGNVDDIKQFFAGRNGPQPSWSSVNRFVEQRDNPNFNNEPKPPANPQANGGGEFNYNDQYNSHAEEQYANDKRQAVENHVQGTMSTWKNAPEVHVVRTPTDIADPDVRAAAVRDDPKGNAQGMYGSDGKTYLFSDRINTPERANAVLFHEGLGHYGLAQLFRGKLDNVIGNMLDQNVGDFKNRVKQWQKDNPGAYNGNRLRAAEEVMAEDSEDNGHIKSDWLSGVGHAVNQFGRKMGLKVKYSDAEITHILSMAHDAVVNGKPGARENGFQGENKFMYTGESSKTFPHEENRLAGNKQYPYHNDTDEQIWNKTGLFPGADGRMRYEISDHDAHLKGWDDLPTDSSLGDHTKYNLEDVLHHPRLYEAYPELRDVKVTKRPAFMDIFGSIHGSFSPSSGEMNITPHATDVKSTMLHEIQHWIQEKEGWDQGGNANSIRLDSSPAIAKLSKFYDRKMGEIHDEMRAAEESSNGSQASVARSMLRVLSRKLDMANDLQADNSEIKTAYAKADKIHVQSTAIDLQIKRARDAWKQATDEYGSKLDELGKKYSQLASEGRFEEASVVHNERMSLPYPKYADLETKIEPLKARLRELDAESETAMKDVNGIKGKYSDLTHDLYTLISGEREARDVQNRIPLDDEQRRAVQPYSIEGIPNDEAIHVNRGGQSFSQTDAMGREQTDPEHLDPVDRLKAHPRYWTDPEYRANVNELARTQHPPEYGPDTGNRFARAKPEQAASPDYETQRLEDVYKTFSEGYTKETRSWEDTQAAAIAAGVNPSDIRKMKATQQGELSTKLHRLQAAANMADSKLADLHEKLDTPDWTPKDQLDYVKTMADFDYFSKRIFEERSEMARALNVSKMASGYSKGTMQEIADRLREEGSGLAGLLDDPDSFNKFARQMKSLMGPKGPNGGPPMGNPAAMKAMIKAASKPGWEQYLLTIHMNMMLSALSTHVKAPVDMSTGIINSILDKALAVPVGHIWRAGTKLSHLLGMQGVTEDAIHPQEVMAHFQGVLQGALDAETWKAMAHALKTGEGSYVRRDAANNPVRTASNASALYGAVGNPRIPGISLPTDAISAQDTFFRSAAFNGNLRGLANRQAARELGRGASMGDIAAKGSYYARTPSPALLEEAYALANRNLLLNDNPLNRVINKYRTFRPGMNSGQRALATFLGFVAPFIRVESNSLIDRIVQRSPLALVDPTGWTQKQLAKGGPDAHIAMAKIIGGTAKLLVYWGLGAAAVGAVGSLLKGQTTGNGPGDVDAYKQKIASGWRPNAVYDGNGKFTTGSNDLGTSINPWDTHNKTAQMVASARQAYESAPKGHWGTSLMLAFGSIMSNLQDNSWTNDVRPTLDAWGAKGEGAAAVVSKYVGDQAATMLPNLSNQVAKMQDPYERDISVQDPSSLGGVLGTVGHTLQERIPGAREMLPIKYSVYGTPLANGASWSGVHVPIAHLGGNGTTETQDTAERELDYLNAQMPKLAETDKTLPKTLITPVTKTIHLDDGSPQKLTPAQFEEYQHNAGQGIVQAVHERMAQPDWNSLSDADKVEEVRGIEADQKSDAAEALKDKYYPQ